MVKALGDPDDVANQYSFDNAIVPTVSADDEKDTVADEPISLIEDLRVHLLSPEIINPIVPIEFKISYKVLEDIDTYIAFSLTDIDRNIWIYNDNTMDELTKGKGWKSFIYKCQLKELNNLKLKLQVSVRDKEDKMIAFANSENSPVIILNRNDITNDDISEKDSATGLYKRNGQWEITNE